MKRYYFIGSAFICCSSGLLMVASCNRDALPRQEEQLVGRWEWVETSGGNKLPVTPALTGHTSAIEFDQQGRACFYQDGSMMGAATFSIRAGSRQHRKQYLIMYHGYRGQQYYTVAGNYLYIQDADGLQRSHVFSRVSSKANSNVPRLPGEL